MAVDVEAYYRRYGPMVLRRCRRLLRDEEKALDAMQDVFVKLLRYEDRLVDRSPSSLLLCMATNVCLNLLRSERRRPEDPDDEMVLHIASVKSDVESRFWAKSSLARLFSREQESTWTIAVLYMVDGMTLEEVATEVGLSISGVRRRILSLKEKLSGKKGKIA